MSEINRFRRKGKPRWSFLAGLLRRGEPTKVIPIYSARRGQTFSARVQSPKGVA